MRIAFCINKQQASAESLNYSGNIDEKFNKTRKKKGEKIFKN